MFKNLPAKKQSVVKDYLRTKYPQYNFIHGANGSIYRGDVDSVSDAFSVEISVTELFDLVSESMFK